METTFYQIVENLVKVLNDKAESAQYYSDNEQYICLCGWCGTMSPVSRPAYYKTFGKDITEIAEAKAREIIAEKEAARQRTKYAEHAQEADRLEGVPAVGGFFWADNSGLKCDGGRGLFEELHALNYYTHAAEQPARLCCVEQIINVSEADFARPGLADELVTRHNLQGFARSEDVHEDDNTYNDDPEKLATFYTVGALVVSPSGKYYLIDTEGYNYARYIYVPIEWPVMLADEVAAVKAAEEARQKEQERQEAEAKAQRLAQYRTRCAKWSHLMKDVRPLEADPKTTSKQIINARKANILAMCLAAFPGVKFSLKVRHGWGADFELTWTDGPTEEEFKEKTDLNLFCSRRDTFDGWDDSTDVIYSEFADFARLTMGSNGGDIKTERVMSDEARAEILAQIFEAVPAANVTNKYGYTEAYTYTNKEAEDVAAALGVDVLQIFANGYAENAETIARRAWDKCSYTKTTTPDPTDPKPGKAQAADTDTTDEAPAEGLQLVEIAEGVAVVGDSRTTYRNRKAIKAHGARWNKTAQQWQASDAEAVARLREWFGVNITPTAEEGDTAHESEPQSNEPTEHTHTTESEKERAYRVIFAACEMGGIDWNCCGYYTGGSAEDWEDLGDVAPEAVTAWEEAGKPLNRNACVRLYGEELTKAAEDAQTVARHRAKYCEEWRDELREIWAIYNALTATDSTTAQTGTDATLYEACEITESPEVSKTSANENGAAAEDGVRYGIFAFSDLDCNQGAPELRQTFNTRAEAMEQMKANKAGSGWLNPDYCQFLSDGGEWWYTYYVKTGMGYHCDFIAEVMPDGSNRALNEIDQLDLNVKLMKAKRYRLTDEYTQKLSTLRSGDVFRVEYDGDAVTVQTDERKAGRYVVAWIFNGDKREHHTDVILHDAAASVAEFIAGSVPAKVSKEWSIYDFITRYSALENSGNGGRVWQFERGTKDKDYELHEIRRVPSGFMVFFNVCEATGGGCSNMVVYPTYDAAFEVLTRCRPGARLITEPAA